MRNFLANFLIFFGIILLIVSSYSLWQRYNPNRLAFEVADDSISSVSLVMEGSEPANLLIQDLDINLIVFPALLDKNRWDTTTKGVSYLTSSVRPGNIGNSIFYGHNYKNILGNLQEARPGQIIDIKVKDGSWKKYRIEYIQTVNPDQVGLLKQTEDKRLTLYTCTGFLDSKRLVVTAFFLEE